MAEPVKRKDTTGDITQIVPNIMQGMGLGFKRPELDTPGASPPDVAENVATAVGGMNPITMTDLFPIAGGSQSQNVNPLRPEAANTPLFNFGVGQKVNQTSPSLTNSNTVTATPNPAPDSTPIAPSASPNTNQIMQNIKDTRVAPGGMYGQPPKDAGYIRDDATGKTIRVPKAPVRDVSGDIDALVSQLMGDPKSKVTQNMGGYTKTGGLKKNVLDQIVELKKAQLGLEGHKMAATERGELTKLSLSEKERHNKLLEQDFALRLSQQKDLNQQKLAESHYQKFLAQEFDTMTGKPINNELHTLLNMGASGLPVPDVFQPSVERAMSGFETYYKKGLSPGAKDTPQNRLKAMQTYKKHTSLIAPEPTK